MTIEKNTIEVKDVSIEFPGVKALQNVNFKVETGEIRAVVGANGAGKSTLMKVIAGTNPTYTGEVYFDGRKVELRNPNISKNLGIEIVYQEVDMALFPSASVAENVMMNKLISGMKGKALINWERIRREAKDVLETIKVDINPDTLVSNLTLAQKQMVLIARAICEKCKFLILDEPTAPLSLKETEDLFAVVKTLVREQHIGVIFISHRLNEILEICQSITVMRNGQVVENMEVTPDLTIKMIVNAMLGQSFDENFPRCELNIGEKTLEVRHISDLTMLKNVSIYARAGEIVGVTGLVGAGKTELCKAIFGARKITEGDILLHGKAIKIKNPSWAVKNKIGLVPEERRKEGVMVGDSVFSNLSAASLSKFTHYGFIDRRAELQNAKKYITDLRIKTPSENQKVAYLSGGNQQKVSVGKWLSADCDIYIFDEPTKGIDVGAKREIFLLIQEIAKKGKTVIYATSETSEILAITNRTYVMYNGQIEAELQTNKTNEKEIVFYATGGKANEKAKEI